MSSANDPGGAVVLRRLATSAVVFAIISLLVTAGALTLLPYASRAGQNLVLAFGGAMSAAAFGFGAAVSFRKTYARRLGFLVVALAAFSAVLFGLIAAVVPESRFLFTAWTCLVLAYAIFVAYRLVHWPAEHVRERPKVHLGIFISYRRQDSLETVGRIHDHLLDVFAEERVFLDVDDQSPGEDYRVVIARALEQTDVMLAIIGADWLSARDREGRRRLDDRRDLVRIEIETGLERNVRVIPVLIENATMPAAADLPLSLQPLCYRTAAVVRPDPDFKDDMQDLIDALLREHQLARA